MVTDPVSRPAHYNAGKYETIDIIEDSLTPEEFSGYCKGNALKYIIRENKKHPDRPTEDLEKAAWYINRLIQARKNPAEPISYHHWDCDPHFGVPAETYAPHGAKVQPLSKAPVVPRSGPHFI